MDKILQIFQEHGLLSQVTVTQSTFNLCDKKPDSDINIQNFQNFEITVPKTVSVEKVNELNSILEKLSLNLEISHKFGLNEKMPHFKNLHHVFSEEPAELLHKPGEVILVDVWATWCGPCQKPMQHNQEMLEKNAEKWKDKVRIVAVSVDEDKETIKTRVNTKGWTKIQHLTLLGWDGSHPLISDFQIQGIPFVFLVDKEGKINFSGHPSEINLEQTINQLISIEIQGGKAEAQEEIKEITKDVTDEINQKQAIKKVWSKQVLQQKFGKAQVFQSVGRVETTISNGKVQKTPLKIKVSAYEDNADLIKEFKQIFKDFDQNLVQFEENLVKYANVPETNDASCAECKAKLEFPFYWCRWDENPNTFRCRECVEKASQEEGLHYAYDKNSVLLGGPCKKIALKGLGNNIQPGKQDISKLKPHGFGCNGCGGCPDSNGQARYICLGCRNDPNPRGDYIDLCSKCFKGYFSGDEEVKNALSGEGHKDSHPLLRILYNVKGYYEF